MCFYIYRVRESSITTTYDPKRLKDMIVIANDLAAFFIPQKGIDKKLVYRAITHHYQLALMKAPETERKVLNKQCDWSLYYMVSRTKLRHQVNFLRNKIGL